MLHKMYYVGCHGDSGHYLWDEDQNYIRWDKTNELQPFGSHLDGDFTPVAVNRFIQGNGVIRFTQQSGWSIINFWDNSIDDRPGSHSLFLINKICDVAEVLSSAKNRFPWVFNRFKFEIVLP